MSELVGLWIAGCVGIATYAFLRLPSWLFLSVNRGCLWRIRDEVYDSRADGRLPDNDATRTLLEHLERAIIGIPRVSPAQVALFERLASRDGWEPRGRFFPIDPDNLQGSERSLFMRYQLMTARVLIRQYFSGSWSGLAFALVHPKDAVSTVFLGMP